MGHGHSHGHSHRADRSAPEFEVARAPRLALLSVLAAVGVATLVGLLLLWPDGAQEIVRSLVSSIGLVLAVPLTTAIAALTVPGAVTLDASRPSVG